ncbi:MAG: lysylphosphatidylglycerol synthase transmembrane domain-containing protein [Ferruginibacter sp.]
MNKNIKILINWLLGPALFLIISFSLYRQVVQQPDLAQRWAQIKTSWQSGQFLLVLLLMFLNWGIEAAKWKLLLQHMQPVSFLKAYKSVLAGCSVTMLTPNRIGEYGGRMLFVAPQHRIKAISLTITGSISQLLITMIMGCLGLFFLRFFSQNNDNALSVLPHFWGDVLIYFSVVSTLLLFLFYIRLGWLVRLMEKLPALNKLVRHISVLDQFTGKQLLQLMGLSLVRYLVFVLQYVLLLQVMDVQISFGLSFWLISVFYLVMAVAPTIGFLELPVRVKASLQLMQLYSTNTLGIQTAALAIWIINLVVPAVLGSILILGIKIVKDK